MSVFKSILISIAAATIFFVVATVTLFVVKSGENNNSILFRNDGDGNFVLLGEKVSVDKNVVEGIDEYLDLCRDSSELIFPDFFITPVKNTAELAGTAVSKIVEDLYIIASDFVYGKM